MNPVDQVKKDNHRTRMVLVWVGLMLGLLGLALVAWFSNVWVALGGFLMIWGNNIVTAVKSSKAFELVVDHIADIIIKERKQP